MPRVNATHVYDLERCCRAVRDLVRLCELRGRLAGCDRKRVTTVSRNALALQRSLGELIGGDAQLRGLLAEYAPPDSAGSPLNSGFSENLTPWRGR